MAQVSNADRAPTGICWRPPPVIRERSVVPILATTSLPVDLNMVAIRINTTERSKVASVLEGLPHLDPSLEHRCVESLHLADLGNRAVATATLRPKPSTR